MITIERYAGKQASVNSYLLSDESGVIAVDLLRNSAEAEELAGHVAAGGKRLEAIFVSHGHPDHYLGLEVFHRRFPGVPVFVASAEIKKDIVGFSQWMESVGWLESEPAMKPRSAANPDGFDYAGVIQVLEKPILVLPSGAAIAVQADYAGTECGHMTTLCIHEQRSLLAFDLLYNGVHAWCGPGVEKAEIDNWLEALDALRRQTAGGEWKIYCGHGSEGSTQLIDRMQAYLRAFLQVTASSPNRKAALDRMKALFPGFLEEDFLLVHSVDHHVPEVPSAGAAAS